MWNRARDMSRPRLIDVDRPASEAVANDPDSDFDDPPIPQKKRHKKDSGPIKHAPKKVPRIGACGVKNLDRTLLEMSDSNADSIVVLCLLNAELTDHPAIKNSSADSVFVARTRDGAQYMLAADEDDLDENEFIGLFSSGPYTRLDPGVCDEIIDHLKTSDCHCVVVVDASDRGLNLARLAANVAMLKWTRALPNASSNAQLLKPSSAKWKEALERCAHGQTWANVRERARAWHVSL
jgi:hypothetical protein|tara:strand:- start:247 stop:957 length:711 start_codon:yes stop_codon:yes gene_type:complete